MERDENGRALAKTGQCPVCRKRLRVLADEDFDCCEIPGEQEDENHIAEPVPRLIMENNHTKINFSVKDIILAMIGVGWKDFKALRYELRTVGYDSVMRIDEDVLVYLLEELEEDGYVEILWDTERIKRIERE